MELGGGAVMEDLTGKLRERARELGLELFGTAPAEAMEEHAGTPIDWMDWKSMVSPGEYLTDAKSFVVTGVPAPGPAWDTATRLNQGWTYPGYYPLEMATWRLADDLRDLGHRVYAHPLNISRKILGRLAGFGPFGKSSLILHPDYGPRFRIATLLTDVELDYYAPAEGDPCGDCTACIDQCPTGAIEPYRIRPADCLITHLVSGKAPRPDLLEAVSPELAPGVRVMCRVCQDVCPAGRS